MDSINVDDHFANWTAEEKANSPYFINGTVLDRFHKYVKDLKIVKVRVIRKN